VPLLLQSSEQICEALRKLRLHNLRHSRATGYWWPWCLESQNSCSFLCTEGQRGTPQWTVDPADGAGPWSSLQPIKNLAVIERLDFQQSVHSGPY
jgi:hypothetical protein